MTPFKCPVCGYDDYALHYDDVGEYRQCKECGVKYYGKEYHSGSPAKDSGAIGKKDKRTYSIYGEIVK